MAFNLSKCPIPIWDGEPVNRARSDQGKAGDSKEGSTVWTPTIGDQPLDTKHWTHWTVWTPSTGHQPLETNHWTLDTLDMGSLDTSHCFDISTAASQGVTAGALPQICVYPYRLSTVEYRICINRVGMGVRLLATRAIRIS